MSKIKKSVALLSFLLVAQPKSEAQLNGEYSFNISYIFGTSPYTFGNYTGDDWSSQLFEVGVGGYTLDIPSATSVHNPKNGSFTIKGTTKFEYYISDVENGYILPESFNSNLAGESWNLSNPPITITGKTYTDRRTKNSLLDTTGIITLKGSYTPVDKPETRITRGSITFKASKVDCNRLYKDTNDEGDPVIRITGFATLANKQTKKFDVSDATLSGFYWGGEAHNSEFPDYTIFESFYLDLNISTEGSNIRGTAKAYYFWYLDRANPSENDSTIQYPDPATPANEFTYSVKGTRRNGIATLNLTGQGVIKGLKATLHINESTEEIVQNGKNSITLYGQTITY